MILDLVSKIQSDYRVVLASQSENRQRILRQSGISDFVVSPSEFKEDLDKDKLSPMEYVHLTSQGKVNDKLKQISEIDKSVILITADTIVVKDGQIYEKPQTEKHAFDMLRGFSGSQHDVMTSVWITIIVDG